MGPTPRGDFLRQQGLDEAAIEIVWDAIALHTTPGIPQHKKPEVALVTAGVEMDVLGIEYLNVPDVQREAGSRRIRAGPLQGADHPRLSRRISATSRKPPLERERRRACPADPNSNGNPNFCSIILNSAWRE